MKVPDTVKTAFWPYDVFGYLIPGVVVIASFTLSNSTISHSVSTHFDFERLHDVALAAGLAYLVGHAVAALSSRLLERLLLRRLWDYPTANLFPIAERKASRVAGWIQQILDPGYSRSYSSP